MGVLLLAKAIKRYRRQHALFQKEIAERLGISREHYARIETGGCAPSFRLLQKISEQLQLNITIVFSKGTCMFEISSEMRGSRRKRT